MFKKIVLKNGLRIITLSQKNTRAVTVLVLVKTGSKYEEKKISGISHFLEHSLFKGTKKRPSPMAVAEPLDKIGGIYNAFTGEDYTGYFAKVESSHFRLALDWISDIYQNSILPKNEIEKERRVIIEEINMYLDTPSVYIGDLWKKLLYNDQPAGWNIAGTKETVERMSREEIRNYMKSQYTASNTIVCIAGRINSKEAVLQAKKYFSKIRTSLPKNKVPVFEKQNRPKLLVHYKKTDQTHLALGVRAYNLFHPMRYAQRLLAVILGGMMTSRLFSRVRVKLGLAYYIKTEVDSDPDVGSLYTLAGINNRKVEEAVSVILEEYKKIRNKKVPKEELRKAKDYVKGITSLSLESSDALASFYGLQELLENRILTLEEKFKLIDRVTSEDILKVAKSIFKPFNLNLALIGPFKNKKKFEELLNRKFIL